MIILEFEKNFVILVCDFILLLLLIDLFLGKFGGGGGGVMYLIEIINCR